MRGRSGDVYGVKKLDQEVEKKKRDDAAKKRNERVVIEKILLKL